MKKMMLSILTAASLFSTGAFASCKPEQEYLAAILMFTGVSSLTGFSSLLSCSDRNQKDVVSNDIAEYKMTGVKSTALQQALASAVQMTSLSENEILKKLTAEE